MGSAAPDDSDITAAVVVTQTTRQLTRRRYVVPPHPHLRLHNVHPPTQKSFRTMPTQRHVRNDDDGIAVVTPMVHPMHHRPIPTPTPLANPIAIYAIGTDNANDDVAPAICVPHWNTHHHPSLPLPRSHSPSPPAPHPLLRKSTVM